MKLIFAVFSVCLLCVFFPYRDLRWEDGFFQHPLSNTYEDEGNPFHKGNCVSEATSYSKGRIRRAITKMSYSVYPMGEG